MSFKVINPGFSSSIQDYGRIGYKEYGLNQAGPMDEIAYCEANYLLENNFNNAVIEMAFGGLEIKVEAEASISVTGADLDFEINNKKIPIWKKLQVFKGDILKWKKAVKGTYSYLAVKGGFQTNILFGSRSTNIRENIGENLKKNDILKFKSSKCLIPKSSKKIPDYEKKTLRIMPTYQFEKFTNHQKKIFFNQGYRISDLTNRTGCRLTGRPIILKKSKMISEGMSYGSVQIANDGYPIILMKDAPTIGGYPKIGTVFSLDLSFLSQKKPNEKIYFEPIDIKKAQSKRLIFNKHFKIHL